MSRKKDYGAELILDMHKCDVSRFNRKGLIEYFNTLCRLIDMKRCKLTFWDDMGLPKKERQTSPHTKGTSAVQFILTSNITIHTLDILGNVYINIHSCAKFDHKRATAFSKKFFNGTVKQAKLLRRI